MAGEGEVAGGGEWRLLPGHWVCRRVQRSLRAGPLSTGLVKSGGGGGRGPYN